MSTSHLPLSARPVESRYPPIPDVILAFVVTLVTIFWVSRSALGYPSAWLPSLVASMGLTLPLAVRRQSPPVMLAVMTAAGLLHLVMHVGPTPSIIAVPIASYSYARWVDGRMSRVVLVIGGVASLFAAIRWNLGTFGNGSITVFVLLFFVCAGSVAVPYLAGRRIREAELADRERITANLQRYQAELARREQNTRISEARIRADIARELHDVVAHSLSVIIVQADGGRALASKRPEAAAEALDTIAETGREALTEMRRIVGVLRNDPGQEAAEYVPNPGLADIEAMVRKAGDRAELVINGTPPTVPPTLGLTVYRVIQEAMTNVLKHAGPDAVARIRLDYEPTQIWLQILDDGVGLQAESDGQGSGLRGMRERVASMGGRLTTGTRPEGGYLVRAVLPVPYHASQHGQSGLVGQPIPKRRSDVGR